MTLRRAHSNIGTNPRNHDELENFLENNDQPGILVLILGLYSKVISSIGEDLSEESVTTLIQAVQRFSTVPLGPIFQAGKLTGFSQRDVDLLKIAYLTRTVSSLNHRTGGLAEFFSSLRLSTAGLAVSARSSLLQQLSAPAPLEPGDLDAQLMERTERTQQLLVRSHVMATAGLNPQGPSIRGEMLSLCCEANL